ncbi:hypothetical protein [Orrella daihaiensis]|uniref:hypothetical protein n=1 Tax=Orrella daihaiensis TaxID=2782176 RepID=UPI001FB47CA5|nr:hypothetical protein [Orrella daihaiensis]
MAIPRLRMFAGPNGSGKSTLKGLLSSEWYGTYVNADDIERTIRLEGGLRLSDFKVEVTQQQLTRFFLESSLLGAHGLAEDARAITVETGYLSFGDLQINSYFASVLADLIRQQLISQGESLTFETVMSSPDKVDSFVMRSVWATALICTMWQLKTPRSISLASNIAWAKVGTMCQVTRLCHDMGALLIFYIVLWLVRIVPSFLTTRMSRPSGWLK